MDSNIFWRFFKGKLWIWFYTRIIGINNQYRSDYKNKNLKIADHLVIDLDRGEIYQDLDENNNSVKEKKILD